MATLSQFFGDAVASGQGEYLTDPRQFPAVYCRYQGIKTQVSTVRYGYEIYFWDAMHAYMNTDTSIDLTSVGGNIPGPPTPLWQTGTVNKLAPGADQSYFDQRRRGNIVQLTDADMDNWVEVCNVTGSSGYLAWVVGPGQNGQTIGTPYTGIKIIVDGVSYEFIAQHIYYDVQTVINRGRLVWGAIQPGTATGTWAPGVTSWGAYEDHGTVRNTYARGIGYGHNGIYYSPVEGNYQLINPWGLGLFPGKTGLRFENSVQCFVMNGGNAVQSTTEYSQYAGAAWTFDYTLPGW